MRKKRPPNAIRARVDAEGRLQVPRKLLSRMKVKPGDAVDVEVHRGELVVHRAAPPGLFWSGGLLLIGGRPTKDLLAEIRRMKQEDLDREMRKCWPT